MIKRSKKRIFCFLAVLCYSLSSLLFPVTANPGFDELLSQRENSKKEEQKESAPKKETNISDFNDIDKDDWFYPYLEYLVKNSIIKGKTPDSFEPQGTFSYAECCTVIVRYLGLEGEAQKEAETLKKSGIDGGNMWYSGYVGVIARLGIFDSLGLYEKNDGKIISISPEFAQKNITRSDFAVGISSSFELEGSLYAKNVYSEIGGRGREFIAGGAYKGEILQQYTSFISDYQDIPEDAKEYVLKAYYNGIFNGDENLNFNPKSLVTRAEMAKVLATILDYSQRKRLINKGYAEEISKEMLFEDFSGNTHLSYKASLDILKKEAEFVKIDGSFIEYTCGFSAPFGYAIDVYLYTLSDDDTYVLSQEQTLHSSKSNKISAHIAEKAKILMVLRNTKESAQSEGVYCIEIENGSVSSAHSTARVM